MRLRKLNSCFDLLEMYQVHAWATEQKLYVYLCAFCIRACVSWEVWHTVLRTCQGVYFGLFWAFGCWCVFFSSALFGLSVTAVKHIPVWTAGWVHTLSINPPLRVHVLTCVNACLCVSMWRWVVAALFIATATPLCHQYLICQTTCQRAMREPLGFPSVLYSGKFYSIIIYSIYLCSVDCIYKWGRLLKKWFINETKS